MNRRENEQLREYGLSNGLAINILLVQFLKLTDENVQVIRIKERRRTSTEAFWLTPSLSASPSLVRPCTKTLVPSFIPKLSPAFFLIVIFFGSCAWISTFSSDMEIWVRSRVSGPNEPLRPSTIDSARKSFKKQSYNILLWVIFCHFILLLCKYYSK